MCRAARSAYSLCPRKRAKLGSDHDFGFWHRASNKWSNQPSKPGSKKNSFYTFKAAIKPLQMHLLKTCYILCLIAPSSKLCCVKMYTQSLQQKACRYRIWDYHRVDSKKSWICVYKWVLTIKKREAWSKFLLSGKQKQKQVMNCISLWKYYVEAISLLLGWPSVIGSL